MAVDLSYFDSVDGLLTETQGLLAKEAPTKDAEKVLQKDLCDLKNRLLKMKADILTCIGEPDISELDDLRLRKQERQLYEAVGSIFSRKIEINQRATYEQAILSAIADINSAKDLLDRPRFSERPDWVANVIVERSSRAHATLKGLSNRPWIESFLLEQDHSLEGLLTQASLFVDREAIVRVLVNRQEAARQQYERARRIDAEEAQAEKQKQARIIAEKAHGALAALDQFEAALSDHDLDEATAAWISFKEFGSS